MRSTSALVRRVPPLAAVWTDVRRAPPVCYEPIPPGELVVLSCSHFLDSACMHEHIVNQLNSGKATVRAIAQLRARRGE